MLHAEFPTTGQALRVVLIDDEPWFAVTDVCRILDGPRGNPNLDVVSESGLHRLIMGSDKATARAFQDWVTCELLPAIRRGDTDPGAACERMAETIAEALNVGTVPEPVSTFELLGQTFQLYSDGYVHCPHGAMDPVYPTSDEDDGPPYGPRFRCTRTERVGILGAKAHHPCPPVGLTDLARVCHRRPQPEPSPAPLIAGAPTDVLTVLNGVR
jgi:hypothetical protein